MRKGVWLAAVVSVCLASSAHAERPSDFFSTMTKTASASGTQTDAALWTVTTGKRIVLQGVIVCAAVPVTGVEIEEDDNTDVIPPFNVESYGCKTFSAGNSALWMGDQDESLTYTVAVAGGVVSITAWGYEAQ